MSKISGIGLKHGAEIYAKWSQKQTNNRSKNKTEDKVLRTFAPEVRRRSTEVSDSRVGGSGGAGERGSGTEFTEFRDTAFRDSGFNIYIYI